MATRGKKREHAPNMLSLVGEGAELLESELPTLRQCLQYGKLLMDRSHTKANIRTTVKDVVPKVFKIWMAANPKMPLINEKSVIDKLVREWENAKKASNTKNSQMERHEFENRMDLLFDICKCQCVIYKCQDYSCVEGCKDKAHIEDCKCNRDDRIPKEELLFMYLQRRKVGAKSALQIGAAIDLAKVTTEKKTTKRKMALEKQKEKAKKAAPCTVSSATIPSTHSDHSDNTASSEESPIRSLRQSLRPRKNTTLDVSKIAARCCEV